MKLRILICALAACGGSSAPAPSPAKPAPPSPPPVAVAPAPSPFTGVWLGTLQAGGKGLRIQLHLDMATTPAMCALDSLDQGAMGIACTNVVASGAAVSVDVPAVNGKLVGTLAGDSISATWSQGGEELPVTLARQAVALRAAPPALDPEMGAVGIDKIQSVLDADFAPLVAGELAPATGIGVTIGVWEKGEQRVFSYGAAKPDSVFEIGSVTKTFTGLVLAQMVQQKQVRLDEPVRELLPKGTLAGAGSGAEITLLDLSAQRSGLPRMPDNFTPADEANPYADYDAKKLYAFVASHGVAAPATYEFGYSNVGVGLLGQLLADRARTTYEALVKREVLAPLGMHDTTIKLTPALAKRFLVGHGAHHAVAHAWDLDALAGAGAIRSTAGDMLLYLKAQLHPESVVTKGSSEARTLPAAIKASHEPQLDAGRGMHVALNWFRIDEIGEYWHNGATGGYSSFALFDPERDFAVIVLANRSIDDGTFADDIGKHVTARLLGKPAVTVEP